MTCNARLAFWEAAKLLLQNNYTSSKGGSNFPQPRQLWQLSFIVILLGGCDVDLTVVLILTTLTTNDAEHLFRCVLAISTFFFFFQRKVYSDPLSYPSGWVVRALYIFWIKVPSLSNVWFANICPFFHSLSFHILESEAQKFSATMKFDLSIFSVTYAFEWR